jgi:hypothetical protein
MHDEQVRHRRRWGRPCRACQQFRAQFGQELSQQARGGGMPGAAFGGRCFVQLLLAMGLGGPGLQLVSPTRHRGAADAREPGVDQDRLAGAQFGAAHQHVPGGLEHEADRGGFGGGERARFRRHVRGGQAHELGRGAVGAFAEDLVVAAELVLAGLAGFAGAARTPGQHHHRVAFAEAGDARPELVHHAAAVAAGDQWQWEGVAGHAAPHPGVEVVDAYGLHAQANLAGGGVRDRALFEAEAVQAAVFAHDDAAHGGHAGMLGDAGVRCNSFSGRPGSWWRPA